MQTTDSIRENDDGSFSLSSRRWFPFTLTNCSLEVANAIKTELERHCDGIYDHAPLAALLHSSGARFLEYEAFVLALCRCRERAILEVQQKIYSSEDEMEDELFDIETKLVESEVGGAPDDWHNFTEPDAGRQFEAHIIVMTYFFSRPRGLEDDPTIRWRIWNICDHFTCQVCREMASRKKSLHPSEIARFPLHFGCRCDLRVE